MNDDERNERPHPDFPSRGLSATNAEAATAVHAAAQWCARAGLFDVEQELLRMAHKISPGTA